RGPAPPIAPLHPSLAKAWPSATPPAPPPGTTSRSGSSRGTAACRLVQYSTLSRPSIGGIAAVPPLAMTTARRATSCSPPTTTVRRSTSLPSPRTSFAPVASSAAAGRVSSRSRAIHSTRFETLGKSTSHSTRDAARVRARAASSSVSPERSSVFDGTHPQYGHSPPTSSRSTTANDRPPPCSSPAIASPATPPPRQTTSNSSAIWAASFRARAPQRFDKRGRGEVAEVAIGVENRGALGWAGQRGGERVGQRARQRNPRLVARRAAVGMVQRARVDLDDGHAPHEPLPT